MKINVNLNRKELFSELSKKNKKATCQNTNVKNATDKTKL